MLQQNTFDNKMNDFYFNAIYTNIYLTYMVSILQIVFLPSET